VIIERHVVEELDVAYADVVLGPCPWCPVWEPHRHVLDPDTGTASLAWEPIS
jgi:hypothetical protein